MRKKADIARHNNLTLCHLLAEHVEDCGICDIPSGHYCRPGLLLRMALGRTVNIGMYEPLRIKTG